MNIEDKVKLNLLVRGFRKETILNNRGLIGAVIDETILEVIKNSTLIDRGEKICLGCKKEQATLGIGESKTLCAKCWGRIFET